ncbi:hypothetical protein [Paenirhodobacter enshiensis]|uniref:hypothetical protein n=1 Tax=Paenirhodobacter enshiensis TaxID=1105367 RepID=UPI0035B32B97
MTTLNAIAAELDARQIANGGAGFSNDWAGFYDISDDEAARIAERADDLAGFETIWENETDWRDEVN